ncbi:Macrolide export ATP-binding/permease protein MacB [hydrothermal vent metagenome]|uniref:Macrolide export ATP-binding/permease protein MacB n=1 Tax=hydrothermal vent metagenome TaxID=652676 RepID=A0A3B1CWN4_9ZZZZ
MAEIKLENVNKAFKDTVVISDMYLTIADGEFFTFLGPSGCGKSTILNMITGLEPVTSGNIYFDNILVNDLSPKERDVAMVFQSYALYPHMTVYENIAFPLRMKKTDKNTIREEVKKVAAILGLEDLLHRKPKELSGGQRQRVALGRAIIRKPKVFLMDEPLSNLDARLRIEMRAELKRLHRELKTTIVYVTHDQAEAMGLSERIAVLNMGEIQQCATPLEIYTRPANTFVAGFIGSPSMNFFEADVLSKKPLRAGCNSRVFEPEVSTTPEADTLLLGIRPEDITVSSEEKADTEALVELVELESSIVWIDLKWKETRLKGKASIDENISAGDMVYITMPDEKIHVFDMETGRRL